MLFKELDQYKYFFLETIIPNEEGALTLRLKIGVVGEPEDFSFNGVTIRDTRPIVENEDIRIEIIFPSFIAYNVRWESYTTWSNYDLFEGKKIREYSRSRYLEYVRSDTIASDKWPGKLRHFGFCCEWHVIDVISTDQPEIRVD